MKSVIMFPGHNGYGIILDEELVGCFMECLAKSTPVTAKSTYDTDTDYEIVKNVEPRIMPELRFVADDKIMAEEAEPEEDSSSNTPADERLPL